MVVEHKVFRLTTASQVIAVLLAVVAVQGCGGRGGSGNGGSTPGTFVYVMNAGPSTVSGFSLNSTTGELTLIEGSPFSTTSGSYEIAIDRKAHVLYLATTQVSSVSPMSINTSTGALSALSGQYFYWR
jgi:Lactonase, 7-bladed beta-propeller